MKIKIKSCYNCKSSKNKFYAKETIKFLSPFHRSNLHYFPKRHLCKEDDMFIREVLKG